ncbi:methyltransferase [Desulfurispora thermophila]|uniref:methyltransferase n=1 Tax=Desulfurispora thermophila TaxID=265470 RepID=UPI0014615FF7|nr:methyltransferase [Desulfurispora thermophila]
MSVCPEGLPPQPRVLHIGGGPLTYARGFAAAGASVAILDLPAVVQIMSTRIRPEENIRLVAGDFNQGLPAGPYELAFPGNICHIHGEEENAALLQRVQRELVPGGRIAIVDMIRGESAQAAIFAVNMLVNTANGGTWTLAQYESWLGAAGFTGINISPGERKRGYNGNQTALITPPFWLARAIVPPCNSATRRQIVNPRPL